MPGLGLGAGLNRRQQNRFNQAAQQGQGQQWLAAHPNIQQRTAGNQAVQNFANTGQVGANAAPRFQPGGAQAPQGSGQTGAPKAGGGGGGQQQTPQQSLAQAQQGAQQMPSFQAPQMGQPGWAQAMAAMKAAQGNQTGQWVNQNGQMQFQPMNYANLPGINQGMANAYGQGLGGQQQLMQNYGSAQAPMQGQQMTPQSMMALLQAFQNQGLGR